VNFGYDVNQTRQFNNDMFGRGVERP